MMGWDTDLHSHVTEITGWTPVMVCQTVMSGAVLFTDTTLLCMLHKTFPTSLMSRGHL